MAEQLESFRFTTNKSLKMNWWKWLNGTPWRLTRGVDFTGTLTSFRSNVYVQAKRREVKVITQIISENQIVIQAIADSHPAEDVR